MKGSEYASSSKRLYLELKDKLPLFKVNATSKTAKNLQLLNALTGKPRYAAQIPIKLQDAKSCTVVTMVGRQ